MAKTPHDTDDDRESHRIIRLEQQLTELRALIGNVAQANAIENVLTNGFSTLSAQLQPLRDLTPTRKRLTPDSREKLRLVQDALKRPTWQGSRFDVVDEDSKDDHDRDCTRGLSS